MIHDTRFFTKIRFLTHILAILIGHWTVIISMPIVLLFLCTQIGKEAKKAREYPKIA